MVFLKVQNQQSVRMKQLLRFILELSICAPLQHEVVIFFPLTLCFAYVAAQKDLSSAGSTQLGATEKIFSQLLDGSGEYTLVYEDNEGDRMLVGDVPWK